MDVVGIDMMYDRAMEAYPRIDVSKNALGMIADIRDVFVEVGGKVASKVNVRYEDRIDSALYFNKGEIDVVSPGAFFVEYDDVVIPSIWREKGKNGIVFTDGLPVKVRLDGYAYSVWGGYAQGVEMVEGELRGIRGGGKISLGYHAMMEMGKEDVMRKRDLEKRRSLRDKDVLGETKLAQEDRLRAEDEDARKYNDNYGDFRRAISEKFGIEELVRNEPFSGCVKSVGWLIC